MEKRRQGHWSKLRTTGPFISSLFISSLALKSRALRWPIVFVSFQLSLACTACWCFEATDSRPATLATNLFLKSLENQQPRYPTPNSIIEFAGIFDSYLPWWLREIVLCIVTMYSLVLCTLLPVSQLIF